MTSPEWGAGLVSFSFCFVFETGPRPRSRTNPQNPEVFWKCNFVPYRSLLTQDAAESLSSLDRGHDELGKPEANPGRCDQGDEIRNLAEPHGPENLMPLRASSCPQTCGTQPRLSSKAVAAVSPPRGEGVPSS